MKIVLILILLITIGESNYAQDIKLGVLGGINYSKVRTDNERDDFEINLGFQLGITTTWTISESLSIISGLNFKQKESKSPARWTSPNVQVPEHEIRMRYLQLPLLIEYGMVENINAFIGPLLEYKLQGVSRLFFSENEEFSTFDYGLACGINYRIDKFATFLEYNVNFNDIKSSWLHTYRINSISLNFTYDLN